MTELIQRDEYRQWILSLEERILICESTSDITVEYSQRDLNKPIGLGEYQISANLPRQHRYSLPSIEQIEAEVEGVEDE